MNIKKIIGLTAVFAICFSFSACGEDSTRGGGLITTAMIEKTEPLGSVYDPFALSEDDIFDDSKMLDRNGKAVLIPAQINTIVSADPAITEILAGLGLADKIAAANISALEIEGIRPDISVIEYMSSPVSIEAIAPDVFFSREGDVIPGLRDALEEAGMNAVYLPNPNSIDSVLLDIAFLAEYTGKIEEGERLMNEINLAVDDILERTSQIAAKKTVYFETGQDPSYSFGAGTFLNDLLATCGGVNIYAGEAGVLASLPQSVIAANPDVIMTSVAYDGYDYNEIKSRPGWSDINAVKNGEVYYVDRNALMPSQSLVQGLYLLAEAFYGIIVE
ncbi:MAG: ABC transporter substrate-binding protein [Oscillospiraceae bacterium]|nr:ABC transporter substrate-binding protein [Oscillospiraceae bacterium]